MPNQRASFVTESGREAAWAKLRSMNIEVPKRATWKTLVRAVASVMHGSVPSAASDQASLVERFIGERAEQPAMTPLKPPSIAMPRNIDRAHEYHQHPSWYHEASPK